MVSADPVARAVPASWPPTSAMLASMAVRVVTRVPVVRPGPAVTVARGPCCSRSRMPVWRAPAVSAAPEVSAVMAVTVLPG